MTSSPAVNGGASLSQWGTRPDRFGFGTASPGVGGAGFTLGRERPVAPPRVFPSASESSPRGFSTRLSPKRSTLAVPCRLRSHLVGRRPSTGLAERRKHGWSAARIPRRPTEWDTADPVMARLSRRLVSVWVPSRPPTVVAARSARDSRSA